MSENSILHLVSIFNHYFSQSYGGIYTDNLRGATQSDTYILRGDPDGEIYEPR